MNIQIDNQIRNATDEEIANITAQRADITKAEQDFAERQILRAAALAKLGLTADEIAALFG